jgi:hypothetical protein
MAPSRSSNKQKQFVSRSYGVMKKSNALKTMFGAHALVIIADGQCTGSEHLDIQVYKSSDWLPEAQGIINSLSAGGARIRVRQPTDFISHSEYVRERCESGENADSCEDIEAHPPHPSSLTSLVQNPMPTQVIQENLSSAGYSQPPIESRPGSAKKNPAVTLRLSTKGPRAKAGSDGAVTRSASKASSIRKRSGLAQSNPYNFGA